MKSSTLYVKANEQKSVATVSELAKLASERTQAVAADHASRETLPRTRMNFFELELAIDELRRRNMLARKRLQLRPHEDIRAARRPKSMSQAQFDAVLDEINDAMQAYLEGLAGMMGHRVVQFEDPPAYLHLRAMEAVVKGPWAPKTSTVAGTKQIKMTKGAMPKSRAIAAEKGRLAA